MTREEHERLEAAERVMANCRARVDAVIREHEQRKETRRQLRLEDLGVVPRPESSSWRGRLSGYSQYWDTE